MITLMAFTAFAVDLGQRNQQLASAQHAIDASVLAAAQYLSAHDKDYAGAARRVKLLLEQNLGVDLAEWADCEDAAHLDVLAPGESNCISFRQLPPAPNGQARYDIRVRLPSYSMDTIFGSALGIDTIDLAASAASNGANCGSSASTSGGMCAPQETSPPTTAPSPTTTSTQAYCAQWDGVNFILSLSLWDRCKDSRPDIDIEYFRVALCARQSVTVTQANGNVYTKDFDEMYAFVWYWTALCQPDGDGAARSAWLDEICSSGDVSLIYVDYRLYVECKTRRPSLQDWDGYMATTTTTTSPAGSPSTTVLPPTSVPTSVDISG